jgi:RES domain-containing protein
MLVFRITSSAFINDLTGTGAKTFGGRWNSVGCAVLYTSQNLSLAAWEVFVNLPADQLPSDLRMAILEIPDALVVKEIFEKDLPSDWFQQTSPEILAKIGDQWLKSLETAVLKVPSAVVRSEHNFLLNPAHPEFSRIKITSIAPFVFDPRSLK